MYKFEGKTYEEESDLVEAIFDSDNKALKEAYEDRYQTRIDELRMAHWKELMCGVIESLVEEEWIEEV